MNAETTVSGKEFHMLITPCIKKFSLTGVLFIQLYNHDGPLCSGHGLKVKNPVQSRS